MTSKQEASKTGSEIINPQDKGAFSIADPRQQRIYRQLAENNQTLADAYFGALYTLSLSDNPDRFRQAAHSLRMMNGLLTRNIELEDEDNNSNESLILELESRINALFSEASTDGVQEQVTQQKISEIIRATINEAKKGRNFAKKLDKRLQAQDPLGGAPENYRKFISDRLFSLQDWFIGIAKGSSLSEVEFRKQLDQLEEILLIITASHFEIKKRIQEIIAQPPTPTSLENIKYFLSMDFRSSEFFFENVPLNWFDALTQDEMFFRDPPEQGIWPQSQFLVRAVSELPKEVMDLLGKIPTITNPLIRENCIVIANSINSGQIASRIIDVIKKQKWFSQANFHHRFYGLEIGKLIEHLFKLGEKKSALDLLDQVLKIAPTEEWVKLGRTGDAQPLIDDYVYEHIVKETCPNLIDEDNSALVETLCKKLSSAYYLESKVSRDPDHDPREDYSYISIPRISSNEVRGEDIKEALVEGIYLLLEKIAQCQASDLPRAVAVIDDKKFPQLIFRRIKFKLYSEKPQLFTQEIKTALLDPSNYNFYEELGIEFRRLVEVAYDGLDPDTKSEILGLLDQEPEFIKNSNTDQDEKGKFAEHWKYKILHPIKNHLPEKHRDWISELENKYGAPSHYEGVTTSWIGPTSPKAYEELINMSLEDLVDFFSSWVPKNGFAEESSEGLGRNFGDAVKQDPDKYQAIAVSLVQKKVRFAYIYHLFSGLEQAIREKKVFSWDNIIEAGLLLSSLSPTDIKQFPSDKEREFDFGDALKALVSLIGDGLVSTDNPIPIKMKADVFSIIEVATRDPEPTLEYEEKYGGDNMDPLTMSINTTRGEAMHTLIKYALWVSKNSSNPPLLEKNVEQLLSVHLDPTQDPSLTIRSVYGRYFPNLHYLNKGWMLDHIEQIFPYQTNKDLWVSAFGTYLLGNMYTDLFELLLDQYKNAVEFATTNPEYNKRVNLGEKLAQHVAWAVAFDLNGAKELANKILASSNEKMKEHFIWFIGANVIKPELANIKDPQYPQPNNLKWLWENVEHIDPVVAENFGYWFFNSPYEEEFTIKQLLNTLKKTNGKIDNDHRIIEKLKAFTAKFPETVLLSVELLIKGDANNWHTGSHINDYREILKEAHGINNPTLKPLIKRIANILAQKRYKGFDEFDT